MTDRGRTVVEAVRLLREALDQTAGALVTANLDQLLRSEGVLELALRTLEAAPGSRTTVQSPLRWSEDADWKLDYCNIDRLPREEIQRRRAAFDAAKAEAKALRT